MHAIPNRLLALAASAALLASPLAFAQSPSAAPPAAPATTQAQASPRVDLEIAGGISLRDYVDYLHETTRANFILLNDPAIDPADIRMPPLKLRRIPIETAVTLLTQLPGTRIEVVQADDDQVPTWTIIANPLFNQDEVKPSGGAAAGPVTKLYPLERMLLGSRAAESLDRTNAEAMKRLNERVDQALQLIDVTLAQADATPANRAQINLHASTHTLIVRGTPAQVDAVEQAIRALAPDPDAEKADYIREAKEAKAEAERAEFAAREALRTRESLEQRLNQLQDERSILRAEVQALRSKMESASHAPSTQP